MLKSILIILALVIVPAAQAISLQTYYNPDTDLAGKIVELNGTATSEIDIMMFSLTEPHIIKSLINALRRNVSVFIVADKGQAKDKGMAKALAILKENGASIKLSPNPQDYMHIKSEIVDNRVNTSGSFNQTSHASKYNYERLDIIYDEGNSQQAKARFLELWNNPNFTEY